MNTRSCLLIVLFPLVAAGLFSGCTLPGPIAIDGNPAAVANMKSIAVVQFTVSPPTMPLFPLLDAAMYNSGAHTLAPQVIQLHKEKVDAYAEILGEALQRHSKMRIEFGKALVNSTRYRGLQGVARYPVSLDNSRYPEAILPSGSVNFLDLSKLETSSEAMDKDYLTKYPETATNMSRLANALGVEGIVLASVTVTHVTGMFGVSGSRAMEMRVLVFDGAGTLVASGRGVSDWYPSSPTSFMVYEATFGQFVSVADKFAQQLFGLGAKVADAAPGTATSTASSGAAPVPAPNDSTRR